MDKFHPILISMFITEDINYINEDIEQQIPFLIKDLQKIGLDDEGASKLISDLKQNFNDKYISHIIRWVVNSSVIYPEDNNKVKQAFTEYEQIRLKNQIALKNLGKYNKFQDLVFEIDKIIRPEELKKQTRIQKINLPGIDLVVDNGQYSVFKVTDVESAVKLASGTKWCISDIEIAEDYLSLAPLFVILKSGKKYALMYVSPRLSDTKSQLKDIMDVDIHPESELLDLLEQIPEVQSFKKKYPIAYTISISKRRNHEIEQEIIRNPDLINTRISHAHPRFRNIDIYMVTVGRIPEFEPIILKDLHLATDYATDVIKGRWPELEAKILQSKDPLTTYLYAINVVKGPWPEGEPAIMKVSKYASGYKAMVDGFLTRHKHRDPPSGTQ